MSIVKKKIEQATKLLDELSLDCWIVFVRETEMMADPVLPLVVGHGVVWESFFIYTRNGDAIALVGNFDEADFKASGWFTEVLSYTEGVSQDFRKILNRLDPSRIAVNYSVNNVAADGLTHGMYLHLKEMLEGTPYAERLVSAAGVHFALRGRKTKIELDRIGHAVDLTLEMFGRISPEIGPGRSEEEIAFVKKHAATLLPGEERPMIRVDTLLATMPVMSL